MQDIRSSNSQWSLEFVIQINLEHDTNTILMIAFMIIQLSIMNHLIQLSLLWYSANIVAITIPTSINNCILFLLTCFDKFMKIIHNLTVSINIHKTTLQLLYI